MYRFLEPRHATAVCNRWSDDHTNDIQWGYFNGAGLASWENVWSVWRPFPPRNGELLRRTAALLLYFAGFLTSAGWEPYTVLTPAADAAQVYASRWPVAAGAVYSQNATYWTLINQGSANWSAPTVFVPCAPAGVAYFDVYAGLPVTPVAVPGTGACAVPVAIEAGSVGGLLAVAATDVNADLTAFLAHMAAMTAVPLAALNLTMAIPSETIVPIPPTTPYTSPPTPNMTYVPAAPAYTFVVNGIEIEGCEGFPNGTYYCAPGLDFQYPQEAAPGYGVKFHNFTVPVGPLYADTHLVTLGDYAAFVAASGYWPSDAHNFLLPLNCTGPAACTAPPALAASPATYVSLNDARAFCAYAGKRLPQEWEWQYLAQGLDSRLYPWGPAADASRVPPPQGGGTLGPLPPVGTYANGTSPFGLFDMTGLVWQWTNEYVTSPHGRNAPLRGYSFYRPDCSGWYFRTAGTLAEHGNYLLLSDSMDRAGTIGFRCVADAAA